MGRRLNWIYSAIIAVVGLSIGIQGQGTCRIATTLEGYDILDLREDTQVGQEIARYTTEGTVESITEDDPDGYIVFEYEVGMPMPLILKLERPLSDSLDQGEDLQQVTAVAQCADGTSSFVLFELDIEDLNNNPPVFNGGPFTFDVSTPWPVGVPINFAIPIFTTDGDFLEANALTSFSSSNPLVRIDAQNVTSNEMPKFRYNLQLFLEDPFLTGVEDEVEFDIVATNGILQPVTTSVTIRVARQDLQPPTFTQTLYKSSLIVTPPNPGDPLELTPPILANDPEGSAFVYDIGGEHASFVRINPAVTQHLELVFSDDFDIGVLQNGVAFIEVIAREASGSLSPLESRATVVILFDIPSQTTSPPTTTTSPPPTTTTTTCPITCPPTPPPITCPPTPAPITCPPTPPPITCPPTPPPITCPPTPPPITCPPTPPPITCPPTPPPTTCPDEGVTDACTPCPSTPPPEGGEEDDCEGASTIGFIIGIAVVSTLFLVAVIVAVYLWLQLRKVSPSFDHLVRVDDSGLTPPPSDGIERWGDMKIDMGTLPIVNLSPTPTTQQPKVQAVNTSIIGGSNTSESLYAPLIVNAELAEEDKVVERPPSPKPDYRTKPDYSVKFQDAVEINPIETRQEAKSKRYDDDDEGRSSEVEPSETPRERESISSSAGSEGTETETTTSETGRSNDAAGGAKTETNPTETRRESNSSISRRNADTMGQPAQNEDEPMGFNPRGPESSDSEEERL